MDVGFFTTCIEEYFGIRALHKPMGGFLETCFFSNSSMPVASKTAMAHYAEPLLQKVTVALRTYNPRINRISSIKCNFGDRPLGIRGVNNFIVTELAGRWADRIK